MVTLFPLLFPCFSNFQSISLCFSVLSFLSPTSPLSLSLAFPSVGRDYWSLAGDSDIMRLIFSHMKDSLIESESCTACPGVSTLTPTHSRPYGRPPRWMKYRRTNTHAHTTYKFVWCTVNYAHTDSGGHTDGSAFIHEMHQMETIYIQAGSHAC